MIFGMNRLKNFLRYYWASKRKIHPSELRKASSLVRDMSDYSDSIRFNAERDLSHLIPDKSNNAGRVLEEFGLAIWKDLIPLDTVTALAKDVGALETAAKSGSNEMTEVRFLQGSQDAKSLIESGQTICVTRDGQDKGMIDAYNVDLLFASAAEYRDFVLGSEIPSLLEEATGTPMSFSNMNVYINRDVTSTRGLHVDSYGINQFKFFTYLTDVESLAKGPYCYGLASHRMTGLRELNLLINQSLGHEITDINLIPRSDLVPILGKAGTSILSNQSAAHGGYPQAPGGFRMLAVMNFVNA